MTEKPKLIKTAVLLIVSSLAIGFVKVPLDYDHLSSIGPIQATIIIMAITISIMLFLSFKIWQGRNWARITFVILFVIGILPGALLLPAEAERSTLLVLGSVFQILLQVAALISIFMPASNIWFKSVKAAKNA